MEDQKREYVKNLAIFLHDNGKVMSGEELADHLNRNHLKTSSDEDYKGGIGTYRFISATYKWAKLNYSEDVASKIAQAFVNREGGYAYDNPKYD